MRFILERNILCGNTLTLKKVNAEGKDTEDPIIFSEWTFTGSSSLRRSDYRLDVLMNENQDKGFYFQTSMFEEDMENTNSWMTPPGNPNWSIPKPIREFSPVYYWRIQKD